LTLTGQNVQDLEGLFDFFEAEGIERACFYHLVPSGRGGDMSDERLTSVQSRAAIEMILAKTKQFKDAGKQTDILTVDNHVDGVYTYLKVLKEDPERAKDVWKLLTWNGGGLNSSGIGIGCIDYDGFVHANQFWGHYSLGSIHEKPFSEIWTNSDEPLLKGLRDRRANIKGRCRLCKYFDACGGSLRVRADLHFGDTWAPDPGCYLDDEQIGLDADKKAELEKCGEVFDMPE
jgi:radical SAM protein with 4Fe4S-binding SPASM domain